MRKLLVQTRIVLTILLLCMSNMSGAIQSALDEQNDNIADLNGSPAEHYISLEIDDEDNDSCSSYSWKKG